QPSPGHQSRSQPLRPIRCDRRCVPLPRNRHRLHHSRLPRPRRITTSELPQSGADDGVGEDGTGEELLCSGPRASCRCWLSRCRRLVFAADAVAVAVEPVGIAGADGEVTRGDRAAVFVWWWGWEQIRPTSVALARGRPGWFGSGDGGPERRAHAPQAHLGGLRIVLGGADGVPVFVVGLIQHRAGVAVLY